MDDKTLHMTMIFDFFGELLPNKQREYFDLYYNEDLSLFEIAEKAGITRQGVHDAIARAENTLEGIEAKTGVVRRWLEARAQIDEITDRVRDALDGARDYEDSHVNDGAMAVLREILESLERLKEKHGV